MIGATDPGSRHQARGPGARDRLDHEEYLAAVRSREVAARQASGPFEQDAANLFFQLVSSRYEHASLVLTSNLPCARWGDVFGDHDTARTRTMN